ncbi:hypothetical protein KXD40_001278 [Peronospora effusa]|nr:hypothetical protein KXD40_001278 [Peronospora effusa]
MVTVGWIRGLIRLHQYHWKLGQHHRELLKARAHEYFQVAKGGRSFSYEVSTARYPLVLFNFPNYFSVITGCAHAVHTGFYRAENIHGSLSYA